jgi:anti-anti-sigma factor
MESKIDIKQHDNHTIIELHGDIDTGLAVSLKRQFDELRDKHRKIIVDFTDAYYINSTGLGVIISEYKRKNFDIHLVIPKKNENISGIVENLNMHNYFKTYNKMEEII